jgi:hypothetical protein
VVSYDDVEDFVAALDAERVIVGPLVEQSLNDKPHWLVLLAFDSEDSGDQLGTPFKLGAVAVSEIAPDVHMSRMAALDQRRMLIELLAGKIAARCNDEFCFVKAIEHEWRCDAVAAIRDLVDQEQAEPTPAG